MTNLQKNKTRILIQELADLARECKTEADNTDSTIFRKAAEGLGELLADVRRMNKTGKY